MKSVFALKIWSEKVLCQYNVNVTNITLIINLSFILITKKMRIFFNDTQGKTVCFGSTGKEKPACPPFFFFFSDNRQ